MHSARNTIGDKRRAGAIDHYIGSRLRTARQLAQLSQQRLGAEIGVTFQQIQKYEAGVSRMSASTLHKIALVLNQPVSFFFPALEAEEHPSEAAYPSELRQLTNFLNTPEGVDLNNAFRQIKDTKLRRSVVALVQSIADDPRYAVKSKPERE